MKGPIHHDSTITMLEAEVTALTRGLTDAVMGRYVPEDNKTALLMMDVQRIRQGFKSSFPIFVEGNSISYAYKLAKETIVSEVSIPIPMDPPKQAKTTTPKLTCHICFDDAIDTDKMFTVDKCRHRLCFECLKKYIEVRLLKGSVVRCPYYRCKSKLIFESCKHILKHEQRVMWLKRKKDDSIPVTKRIYCPNPRCSALMSETELSKSTGGGEARRLCLKCRELFCINCKVSWHSNLSCQAYKWLHPYPTENDRKIMSLANQKEWRRCGKCQHMIERSSGCVQVRCRCGYKFCYRCGVQAGDCDHGPPPRPPPPPQSTADKSVLCLLSCQKAFPESGEV
ncbi:probable E3 ubiquitin-protein ligase RNF217 [Capsella rubella]|uniref:probable E3 ubiquitin-protein ligase RNF217 n=1 Tax=Capsella rubella TaxID=81985 RepID=UPI000CD55FB2|nr:probable E3 ubiquitin-protein ligase RNF217 [Capsella rubella]